MDLKKQVRKLAAEHPELREHLVPLLRKTSSDFDASKFEKNISAAISKIIKKKVNLTVNLGPKGLLITSPDLSDTIGLRLFKSLHIKSFNYSINDKEDLADNDSRYWVTVNYSWTNFGGGSNGTQIATLWVNDDGTIKHIRPEIK